MKKFAFIVFVLFTIISCKDDDANNPKLGTVNINFKNKVVDDPITLNTSSHTNQSNETYTISELKYIISNIVLIKENGDEFTYPVADSYFLINEEVPSSKRITLNNIDNGTYSKIRLGFGVDQSNYPLNGVANFIPTAEENEMLWSWSAGYIFLKFEGSFTPQGGTAGDFLLHIGSHGTNLDNYKEITLDLPNLLTVGDQTSSDLSIEADIAKIFDGTYTHSLEQKSDIQVDPDSENIANNVQTMFNISTAN